MNKLYKYEYKFHTVRELKDPNILLKFFLNLQIMNEIFLTIC